MCSGLRDSVIVSQVDLSSLKLMDYNSLVPSDQTGFAPKVNLRLMVRQVPTRSSPDESGDKFGTHHERKYENPFALSDSLIGISSSRLLSHMKVVGIPKAFGRLFRLVAPMHREERDDSSESLSKGDLAKQGTFGAKLAR